MKKNIEVLVVLMAVNIIAVLFLLVPYNSDSPGIVYPYPLNKEAWTYLIWYVQQLNDRITHVLFYVVIISLLEKPYKTYIVLFCIMEILLILEYMLSYNSTWFILPLLGRVGLSHFFIIFKALILTNAIWEQSK